MRRAQWATSGQYQMSACLSVATGFGQQQQHRTTGRLGFSCLEPVQQGLLSGCQTGQGVRWDTEEVLTNTMFKCTGAASEAAKPATTNAHTVVLRADFYRAGDANEESFTAQIIALTTTSPQI